MPLFTIYEIYGEWTLGPIVCDAWLAIDYLASNSSVLNLLVISFDRYFSVTQPLSYRAKRTTKKAAMMIASAWLLSLIIWVPAIYGWPVLVDGERIVDDNACFVQFIKTSQAMSIGAAMAAFYIPVMIMCGLYCR